MPIEAEAQLRSAELLHRHGAVLPTPAWVCHIVLEGNGPNAPNTALVHFLSVFEPFWGSGLVPKAPRRPDVKYLA